MKRIKRLFLIMTCALALFGTTACGSSDGADNGADQSDDRTMNDATGGNKDKDNGVLDDAVDDVTDGVDRVTDDVTDDVDRATDEMTEDHNNDSGRDDSENR